MVTHSQNSAVNLDRRASNVTRVSARQKTDRRRHLFRPAKAAHGNFHLRRLARVARIYELAVKVYADRDDAKRWLGGQKRRFDGKTALSMLRTEAGERAVQDFLIQIDEGYFA